MVGTLKCKLYWCRDWYELFCVPCKALQNKTEWYKCRLLIVCDMGNCRFFLWKSDLRNLNINVAWFWSWLTDTRVRMHHLSHKFGNKCEQLLARALRHQRASSIYIHMAVGSPVIHSSKISAAFRDYYAQLYHLPNTLPSSSEAQKTECILQYLEEAQLHKWATNWRYQSL